ncbi:MAG: hypothetical protein J1E63_03455 [Muribaculaceae bacterium]|nr:hypothetical protein [Muribaculaceae bacterium]
MLRIFSQNDTVIPSCRLDNVFIFSDADAVDVTIAADGTNILRSRYFLTDNTVSISNLRELIELYIRENTDNNIVSVFISASTSNEEADTDLKVMYCDRDIGNVDFAAWLNQNFLSVAPFHRVAPSDVVRLSWYSEDADTGPVSILFKYFNSDGILDCDEYFDSFSGEVGEVINYDFFVKEWIDSMLSPVQTLVSVTLRVGDRSVTLFVDQSLNSARRFAFRNCFNIVETLPILCTTIAKATSDRSIASVGRSALFYDVKNAISYDTETAPLSVDECILIEQLCLSHKVKIIWDDSTESDFDALPEILITDFTCEISDSLHSLNRVKFTWQFADSCPKFSLPPTPGIFSDTYNPVFS